MKFTSINFLAFALAFLLATVHVHAQGESATDKPADDDKTSTSPPPPAGSTVPITPSKGEKPKPQDYNIASDVTRTVAESQVNFISCLKILDTNPTS